MASRGTPETFIADVEAWTEKAKGNTLAVVRETIQDINNEIVKTTPFVTGHMRRSYFANLNDVPMGTSGLGMETVMLNAVAAQLQLGDRYVMGNTAKYARRVHEGFVGQDSLGRNYSQRGRFWMRAVLNRASAIAMEAAQRVAARG